MVKQRKLLEKEGLDAEDERKNILDMVHEHPVLDVGTGDGWLAIRAARDYDIELISIDNDIVKLENARHNAKKKGLAGKIEFMCMDACEMCFPDHYFGTVMAYQTIHHSLYPFRVVDEMFRVCRERGTVIISELNREGFECYAGIYYRYPGEKNRLRKSEEPVNIQNLCEYLEEKSSRVFVEKHGFTSLTYCKN